MNSTDYERFREEAEVSCPHLSEAEKDAWAEHAVKTHPGFHDRAVTRQVIAVEQDQIRVQEQPGVRLFGVPSQYVVIALLVAILGVLLCR